MDRTSQQGHRLSDSYTLAKISTIAEIAGRLTYASMSYDEGSEQVAFTLTPDRAAEMAEEIFNAVERRVMGR